MTDNEELENRNDALIEEYLLFLRGCGPEANRRQVRQVGYGHRPAHLSQPAGKAL